MASKQKVFAQVREDLEPAVGLRHFPVQRVEDDHYRISVSRSLGQEAIDTDADSAIDDQGGLCVAWTRTVEAQSSIIAARVAGDSVSEPVVVSSRAGAEGSPRIAHISSAGYGVAYVVWAARRDASWLLLGCEIALQDGRLVVGTEEVLDHSCEGVRAPAIALVPTATRCGHALVVAWERVEAGRRRVAWRARLSTGWTACDQLDAVDQAQCFRPAVSSGAAGEVQIAYDVALGGAYNVTIVRLPLDQKDVGDETATRGKSIEANATRANSMHPAILRDGTGSTWLAYTSNRRPDRDGDLVKWIRLYRVTDSGQVEVPYAPQTDVSMDSTGEDQGWEFPSIIDDAQGRIWVFGRSAHSFHCQYWDGCSWSHRVDFTLNAWGKRGKHISVNRAPDGLIWLVYEGPRYLEIAKLATWAKGDITRTEPGTRPVAEADYAGASTWVERAERESPGDYGARGYKLYFGDIHSHSYHSDGTGDADEFFMRCRDLLGMDFCALTDHEYFCQKSIAGYTWAEICQAAASLNSPGEFVVFPGYEWTGNAHPGPGHKHVVYPYDYPPLFTKADSAYDDDHSHDFAIQVRKSGGLSIPHHTAWSGVDRQYHDADIEPIMEICSAHGANEFLQIRPIPPRDDRYFEGYFTQDLYRQGLKFGLVGGTDNHGLLWHHGTSWTSNTSISGLTAVYARDLTREAIWEALLSRRTYATSGAQVVLGFSINGHLMGSEVKLGNDDSVSLSIQVRGTSPLCKVTVVKDCSDYREYRPEDCRFDAEFDDAAPEDGETVYYIRVVQNDGHMAWSSPIWVVTSPKRT
ncbi:MAG: CehA/McbA family metallohydrolase [Clostridia bacterium]|nr:CehA/McbA family metallohydrolase [Clostridia bacterium]